MSIASEISALINVMTKLENAAEDEASTVEDFVRYHRSTYDVTRLQQTLEQTRQLVESFIPAPRQHEVHKPEPIVDLVGTSA